METIWDGGTHRQGRAIELLDLLRRDEHNSGRKTSVLGRGFLTGREKLPADDGHHQRGEQLKPHDLWKVPPQASPQVAA